MHRCKFQVKFEMHEIQKQNNIKRPLGQLRTKDLKKNGLQHLNPNKDSVRGKKFSIQRKKKL